MVDYYLIVKVISKPKNMSLPSSIRDLLFLVELYMGLL